MIRGAWHYITVAIFQVELSQICGKNWTETKRRNELKIITK